jgi:hypothetical protein
VLKNLVIRAMLLSLPLINLISSLLISDGSITILSHVIGKAEKLFLICQFMNCLISKYSLNEAKKMAPVAVSAYAKEHQLIGSYGWKSINIFSDSDLLDSVKRRRRVIRPDNLLSEFTTCVNYDGGVSYLGLFVLSFISF